MALSELSRSVRLLVGQIQRCRSIVATNQTGELRCVFPLCVIVYKQLYLLTCLSM